jgi:FADH2 O2-dependent halogenase
MNADCDLAIIGSGFGGSLVAMIARRLGRSVVLVERGRHPRFAIGESSTPLANLLLEELARRYDLPAIAPLAKWGSWQRARREISCGLKRGFTFYHHVAGREWTDNSARNHQLLVAASPHDGVADTHWYRPEFDHFLAREAQGLGAELLEETRFDRVSCSATSAELSGERDGKPITLRARFVIDASGPRGFLHHALGLGEAPFSAMPRTQALYSHFGGVRRWDELHASTECPPYPVDDAAVHHVFDGGWIWVLRFNNGLTSAGVAATDALAAELRFADGEPAWRRLLERLPSVRDLFAGAVPRLPFIHAPRLSFRSARVAGEGWALLPSAAGFVDPLLSTGFPLTLLGVERLARLLAEDWESARLATRLRDYEWQTLRELDVTSDLIGALYRQMDNFDSFRALTLLYFAAAMHAETTRRLGAEQPTPGFLLHDHPQFGPALRACMAKARGGFSPADQAGMVASVLEAIAPINLARLGDPARRHWYPCLAGDLLAAAPKLGTGSDAIQRLLLRCGFGAR